MLRPLITTGQRPRAGLGRLSAGMGLIAWLAVVLIEPPPLGISVFLWAPLVLAPLTLALLAERERQYPWLWLGIICLQLPAALLLLTPSPALSWPWLAVTLLIAAAGSLHLWRRGFAAVAELGIDAGLVYLAVGGVWMVLARQGARPLDFPDAIVQATATHFHYAGFMLPVLAGLAARRLDDRLARATVVGVIAGVPLVAVGITLSAFGVRWPEWLAAWFMAGAGGMMAWQQVRLALASPSRLRRGLFLVSGGSLAVGMALAALYALGNCLQADWLDIPAMIHTHGLINALGFALPGLLAWQVDLTHSPPSAPGPRRTR